MVAKVKVRTCSGGKGKRYGRGGTGKAPGAMPEVKDLLIHE